MLRVRSLEPRAGMNQFYPEMADSSDTGSIQSLQADNNDEQKSEVLHRHYALYSINSTRSRSNDKVTDTADDSGDKADEGGSSLSVLASNLCASAETALRNLLSLKLPMKSQNGEGNFSSIGLCASGTMSSAASCYYCHLRATSDVLGFDHVTNDGGSEEENHQQYIICFISFQESTLELFRPELDSYSQGLLQMLDKELTQLNTKIQAYLENWPFVVLEYLTRTLQYLGPNVDQLIYASLLSATLQITDATPQQESDIKRFSKCCSLSSLIEPLQASDASIGLGNSEDTDLWHMQPLIVSVKVNEGSGVIFDKNHKSQFCKNAGEKLSSFKVEDVTRIREFLESVKLAFVHNLNKLKRFLKQAELDHYALYRALSYLKKCGCGHLLLRYVKLDAGGDIKDVLVVLESFISNMTQMLA